MKRELLAATAALMICASAHAGGYELQCGAPVTFIGEDANDTNPVTATAVGYSWDDHAWRVFHQLRNGAVVSRQTQYGMTDTSNSQKTQWQGKLLRQPWLFMIGEIKKSADGSFTYNEWMYDTKAGNRLVMQSLNRCTARQTQPLPTPTAQLPTQPYAQAPAATPQAQAVPPAQLPTQPYAPAPAQAPQARPQPPDATTPPAPTQQAPAPQVAARTKDSVPIIVTANGESIHVDVLVGGMPLRMLVDTGAMGSQVPPTFASMLLRNGSAIKADPVIATYANGSKGEEPTILIREIRLGSHVVRDVRATVTDGTPLIGFPIINGIAPFTIDTRQGELVWHTTRG